MAHHVVSPLVLWPLMAIETLSASVQAALPNGQVRLELLAAGLVLLVCIWGLTLFIQRKPARMLTTAFDPSALRSLLRANCFRSVCWGLRAVVVLLMLADVIA